MPYQCPMGCGPHVIHFSGGAHEELRCTKGSCPRPTAVMDLLADAAEAGHIVRVHEDLSGWSLKHPLRERIENDLLTCSVHVGLSSVAVTQPPGLYRVTVGEDGEYIWDAQ